MTVFWRPGCGFCMRLEGALARAGVEYQRRNIWEDDEAAAFVRSVNNGNETVPTVVIGDEYLTNPSTATVLSKLGVEPPPSSGIGRLFGR
jgi:mycoredoxin